MGDMVQAELDHQRHHKLKMERDTNVFLSPRDNQVFVNQI
jgi:hypothetical protein